MTFSPFERSVAKKFTSAFKVGVRLEECGRESVNAVVASSAEEGPHSLRRRRRRDADQEEEEVQRQVPPGESTFPVFGWPGPRALKTVKTERSEPAHDPETALNCPQASKSPYEGREVNTFI